MNGRERSLAAINLEQTDKVPHTEYCSNWELIRTLTGLDPAKPEEAAAANKAFYERAGLDFMWSTNDGPVPWERRGRTTSMGHAEFLEGGIDMNRNVNCPFKTVDEVLSFDAVEEYGLQDDDELAAYYESLYQRTLRDWPDVFVPIGYYRTMVSACIAIFGWEMFLTAVGENSERFDRVLESIFRLNLQVYEAQAKCSCPVFLCHDDMVWTQGPIFHPDWYRKHIFPRYKKLWSVVKDSGKKLLFCSDGDFSMFLDDLAAAGADGFIFEPMVDFGEVCERFGKTHAIIGSYVDCRTLTFGTKEQVEEEVRRSFEVGKKCPGFIIAVGNHIPSNVPVEMGLFYLELVEKLRDRT